MIALIAYALLTALVAPLVGCGLGWLVTRETPATAERWPEGWHYADGLDPQDRD